MRERETFGFYATPVSTAGSMLAKVAWRRGQSPGRRPAGLRMGITAPPPPPLMSESIVFTSERMQIVQQFYKSVSRALRIMREVTQLLRTTPPHR